jgi:hypothetical protein
VLKINVAQGNAQADDKFAPFPLAQKDNAISQPSHQMHGGQ